MSSRRSESPPPMARTPASNEPTLSLMAWLSAIRSPREVPSSFLIAGDGADGGPSPSLSRDSKSSLVNPSLAGIVGISSPSPVTSGSRSSYPMSSTHSPGSSPPSHRPRYTSRYPLGTSPIRRGGLSRAGPSCSRLSTRAPRPSIYRYVPLV